MAGLTRSVWAKVLAVLLAICPVGALAQPYGPSRGPVPIASELDAPTETAPAPPASSKKRSYPNRYGAYSKARLPLAAQNAALPSLGLALVPAAPAQIGAMLTPNQGLPPFALQNFVDGYVRNAMQANHIAGAVVIVVQNGQIVMKKGYGLAQLNPARAVNPDQTLFRLASISKTLTWIALMQQVEAGKVRLDAPINTYLPEDLQIPDKGFSRPILVRDLMAHETGFEDRALGQLFEQDPSRIRALATYLRQERPERVREAGQFPTYSNYGAALAGEIVAHLTGQTFEQYVERQITGKLGLSHLTLREPYPKTEGLPAPMRASLAQNLSQGFVWNGAAFETRPFEHVSHIGPAGSGSATASDMGRYMQMILNGGNLDGVSLYGPATANAFRTPLVRPALSQNGWNHGFMDYALPGGFRGQGHAGATLMFMSNMVTVPQLGLGVFVATNTGTGQDMVRALPGQIVGQFYVKPNLDDFSGSKALIGQGAVYDGAYRTTRRAYSGLHKLVDSIFGEVEVRVTADGQLLLQSGGPLKVYKLSDKPNWFSRLGSPEIIRFDIEGKRAVRFYDPMGTQAFERINWWQGNLAFAAMAGLTVLAALFLFIGQFSGRRPDYRQTKPQRTAHLVQASAAGLWIASIALFGMWGITAMDVTKVFFDWPNLTMTLASSSALLATVLTLVTLGLSPMVWAGGRRLDSWNTMRKLRFTLTVAIFTGFGLLLALRGGLEPWNA